MGYRYKVVRVKQTTWGMRLLQFRDADITDCFIYVFYRILLLVPFTKTVIY